MKSRLVLAVLPAVLTLAFLSCGSGDDVNELNLTGTWRLTANLTNDPCGAATANPELRTLIADVTVQQSGSQLVFKDADGNQFIGTLSGANVTFTATRMAPDSQCTLITLLFSGNGTA